VRALLAKTTPQARQMLRRLLVGKIVLEPVAGGYRFTGNLGLAGILSGETRKMVVAPTGFDGVTCSVEVDFGGVGLAA